MRRTKEAQSKLSQRQLTSRKGLRNAQEWWSALLAFTLMSDLSTFTKKGIDTQKLLDDCSPLVLPDSYAFCLLTPWARARKWQPQPLPQTFGQC